MIFRPLFILLLLFSNIAYCQQEFKITISTNEIGSSCAKCFTIPTIGAGYNYSVDWESDGIIDQTGIIGNVTKTYENVGIYTITIGGSFPQIYFNNSGDAAKLISIKQWGSQQWRSMEKAFYGCNNMVYNATDKPDLGLAQNLSYMFAECSKFDGDVNNWQTSQVTNMMAMFYNAVSFNKPLDRWTLNTGVTLDDFLSNSGMDCGNYSRTLVGWAIKIPTISNKKMGVNGLQYGTIAESHRIFLISKGWVFSGDSASTSDCDKSSFIFTWKTDGEGSGSCPTCVNIYANGLSDKFDIDWNNDGVFEEKNVTNTFINDYVTPGTYTIRIVGKMESPPFIFSSANGKLISIDQWGVISWKNLKESFKQCTQLTINATDAPVLDECTSMSSTFENCPNFNSDISHWDVSNIKSMDRIFTGCKKFNKPLQKWNISKVENLNYAFLDANEFNQPLVTWNVSNVKSMRQMFRNAKTFNHPIDTWNTYQVTDMFEMFKGDFEFNQNLGNWNFNAAVNMDGLLSNSGISCSNYSATLQAWAANPNIPTGRTFTAADVLYTTEAVNARNILKTSKSWLITGDKELKGSCNDATKPLILEFKTDNSGASCNSCINLDMNSLTNRIEVDWNDDGIYDEVSSEKSIVHDYGTPGVYSVRIRSIKLRMTFAVNPDKQKLVSIKQWGDINYLSLQDAFSGCLNLAYKAIDKPNLYNITSLSSLFNGCTTFNGPIGSWDVSRVTNMNSLFGGATSFNQSLGGWDVRKVTSMTSMFDGATAFNQSLGAWTFSSNVNLTNFLKNAGLSCINYAESLRGWRNNTLTPNNLNITVNGLKYPPSSVVNRNYLINTKMWSFNGDFAISGECVVKPMVFKIKTDNPGESCATCFTLVNNSSFPYDIDWNGDGFYDELNKTGIITHNFGVAGVYTIKIAGHTNFGYGLFSKDPQKLVSFDQWGEVATGGLDFFSGCLNMIYTATDIPIFRGNTIDRMFKGCIKFNSDISNWDLSKIEFINEMFFGAISFNQNINNWDVSNVKLLWSVFSGASSFNQPLDQWDVSNVFEMSNVFQDATSFNQNINSWNVSKVKVLSRVFTGATSFNQALDKWDVSNVVNMEGLFWGATSFNQNINIWDVSNVKNLELAFLYASSFDQSLNNWNVSNVENMSSIFSGARKFNQNINNWSVSNVKNLSLAFADAVSFNQPLDDWDVSNVENMAYIFSGAKIFNQNINTWNVSKVGFMQGIFSGATNFNQNINIWDVSNVKSLTSAFSNTSSFNQPLDQWNVSKVENMDFIFNGADSFNQNINNWNVSKVNTFLEGFAYARSFNQPLNQWDVSNVENMQALFWEASNFNQNINSWTFTPQVNLQNFLGNSGMSCENYSNTLIGWADNPLQPNNLTVGCEGLKYQSAATPSRDKLINQKGWTIQGDIEGSCNPLRPMIVTFRTDIIGGSCGSCVTLGNIFNQQMVEIDWNNDRIYDETSVSGEVVHDFGISGTYTIRISAPSFSQFFYNQDSIKLVSFDQWGDSEIMGGSFFYRCTNMTYNAIDNPKLIGESIDNMFNGCKSFNGNISDWDVSNVESMANTFSGASNFNQNINTWDVSNVESMVGIFSGASNFNQNINNWDVSKNKNLSNAFAGATYFNQPLTDWDVSNVESMVGIFSRAYNFNQNINNWDVSKNKDLSNAFIWAISFNQPLDNWDVSNVESMVGIFKGASNFNQNINNWDVSKNKNLSSAFEGATLFNQSLNNWDVSNVDNLNYTFSYATSFNKPLTDWDVSNVESMAGIFFVASNFNQNINNWDVSKNKDLSNAFAGATSFNQSLNNWDVSNVESMVGTFSSASNFNQNINNWNVSKNKNLSTAFAYATSFNQSLNNWDVSNVDNLDYTFLGANSFNQPLDSWDVSKVEGMYRIFSDASNFNQNINNWDVSKNKNLARAFEGATSFNQSLNNWNVSNVDNLNYTFGGATSFNQPLDNWDVSKVESMVSIFSGASNFNQNINNWDVSKVNYFYASFYDATSFNQSLSDWTFAPQVVLENFLDNAGMSCDNYSKTLIGWADNPLQPNNLTVGCEGLKYPSETTPSRDKLINQKGWTILGDNLGNCDPLRPMIVTFKTDIIGGSCGSCVTLGNPFNQQKIEIDWNNDGIYDETSVSGEVVHDFGISGTYTIRISAPLFSHFFYNQDSIKLVSFDQWGDSEIMGVSFFYGCTNMTYNAIDNPKLIGESIDHMFNGCKKFNGDLSDWDVSNVESMVSTFTGASNFNQNINNWDVSNVKYLSAAFAGAISYNQPLDNWDVSNVKDMGSIFEGTTTFNQNINNWDVSKVNNFYASFYEATLFNQPLSDWTFAPQVVLENFLDNSGMSCDNYSKTLMGWADNQTMPDSLNIGVYNLSYNESSKSAHDHLSGPKRWTFVGDSYTQGLCDQSSNIVWVTSGGTCYKDSDGQYKIKLDWTVSDFRNIDFYIELITVNQEVFNIGFIDAEQLSTSLKSFNFIYEVPDSLISKATSFRIKAAGSDMMDYFNTILVNPCNPVGTTDSDSQSSPIFYPNPIVRNTSVNLKAGHDQIFIYDLNGKIVKILDKNIKSWEVSLSLGTYVIKQSLSNTISKLIVID